MPSHIVRLIILLVIVVIAGLWAKVHFTPDSFGDYGYYRGDSVKELASQVPIHQAPDACKMCHWERFDAWQIGRHKGVNCQVCHGPAGDHPASGKLPISQDTASLCGVCHEAMPGRPSAQPQVDLAAHAGPVPCTACHNPHTPAATGTAKQPGSKGGET